MINWLTDWLREWIISSPTTVTATCTCIMYSSHDITRLKKLSSNAKYYLEKLIPMSLVLLDLPEAAAFPSPSPNQLLHLASQNCTKQTFNNVNRVCILLGTITFMQSACLGQCTCTVYCSFAFSMVHVYTYILNMASAIPLSMVHVYTHILNMASAIPWRIYK